MKAKSGHGDLPLVRNPAYQQLNERLRTLIRENEFPAGTRFLTEREIAARFLVSRPTANKALASLVTEGVLEFRKGVGTFVREGVLNYDLRHLVSFTEQARLLGKSPSTEVLAFRSQSAEEMEEAAREALAMAESVFYIERLRLADEIPVIFERRYIDARFCPNLTKAEVSGSLYSLWTETYGLRLAGADETIRAVCLTRKQAESFKLKFGAAGLLVESTGYVETAEAKAESPLWWEETLYRADAYVFHNRIGGLVSKPAVRQLVAVVSEGANASPRTGAKK
jgi:GntR family transcriptional regulator